MSDKIRRVKHPLRGVIEVRGSGAATYWRDPDDTTSPFAGRFLLASPEFRAGIEEAEKAKGNPMKGSGARYHGFVYGSLPQWVLDANIGEGDRIEFLQYAGMGMRGKEYRNAVGRVHMLGPSGPVVVMPGDRFGARPTVVTQETFVRVVSRRKTKGNPPQQQGWRMTETPGGFATWERVIDGNTYRVQPIQGGYEVTVFKSSGGSGYIGQAKTRQGGFSMATRHASALRKVKGNPVSRSQMVPSWPDQREQREFHRGYCTRTVGPRGGMVERVEVWRRSGKTQTWKTRPNDFRTPIKHGLYDNSAITQDNAHEFHVPYDCPLRTIKGAVTLQRSQAYLDSMWDAPRRNPRGKRRGAYRHSTRQRKAFRGKGEFALGSGIFTAGIPDKRQRRRGKRIVGRMARRFKSNPMSKKEFEFMAAAIANAQIRGEKPLAIAGMMALAIEVGQWSNPRFDKDRFLGRVRQLSTGEATDVYRYVNRYKRNPLAVYGANPKRVTTVKELGRVVEIRYKRKDDGGFYKHDFKTRPRLLALSDGTIAVRP